MEEEVLVYINRLNVTDRDSRQFGIKGVRMSIERPSECPLLVREHKGSPPFYKFEFHSYYLN